MNPIFKALIKHGKVVFYNVDMFNGYLISLEGKDVDVIVKKHKKTRSLPQNAYYFGVVVKLVSEETGFTSDEAHVALKMLFLQDRTREIPTLRSTTSLSTTDFENYLEQIRVWAAQELNCVIPLPNEVMTDAEIIKEPTPKEVKKHRDQAEIEAKESKSRPVDSQTLEEIFGWVGKEGMTQEKIIKISKANFNGREPRELTQNEAESLDTIIISELPL